MFDDLAEEDLICLAMDYICRDLPVPLDLKKNINPDTLALIEAMHDGLHADGQQAAD